MLETSQTPSPAWSGDAASACVLAAVLASRGLGVHLVRQVAVVVRTAGLPHVAALGPAVLRDPVAGAALARELTRASQAPIATSRRAGKLSERVAAWLESVATAQAAIASSMSGGDRVD